MQRCHWSEIRLTIGYGVEVILKAYGQLIPCNAGKTSWTERHALTILKPKCCGLVGNVVMRNIKLVNIPTSSTKRVSSGCQNFYVHHHAFVTIPETRAHAHAYCMEEQ